MLFISICWLFATAAIILGYFLTTTKSTSAKILTDATGNLYLFGKVRSLQQAYGTKKINFLQFPKSWFCHFYFAGIICNTVVLSSTVHAYVYSGKWSSLVEKVINIFEHEDNNDFSPLSILLALVMVEIQVIRRFLECVFINSYSNSTMSLVIYSAGVLFYSILGVSIICQAPQDKINFETTTVSLVDVLSLVIFAWASYKQHRVNTIMAKLRQDKSGNVANHKHHIPHGDLFSLVSCPHYLMEIIIYTSLNVLFLGRHQVLLCIWTFVASNQVISAILTHTWYKDSFKNYPKERRALIPYVF